MRVEHEDQHALSETSGKRSWKRAKEYEHEMR